MLEGMTPPPRTGTTCKVETISRTLEDKDKKILIEAVNDQARWSVKNLIKALNERGLQISDTPIYNHRAKTCACFRS